MFKRRWRSPVVSERELQQRQKEAENAIVMTKVGLMAAEELDRMATRVQLGHLVLQTENHLGEKMFGVRE